MTQQELKKATKLAYQFAFSIDNVMFHKRPKFDQRTRIGKLALSIFKKIKVDKTQIVELKTRRRAAKHCEFSNVLSNPLVKDWMKNAPKVFPNHLSEGHRNHWAKSQFDRKILSILLKWQNVRNFEALAASRNLPRSVNLHKVQAA